MDAPIIDGLSIQWRSVRPTVEGLVVYMIRFFSPYLIRCMVLVMGLLGPDNAVDLVVIEGACQPSVCDDAFEM